MCVYACVCIHACMYVYMCVCLHVCMHDTCTCIEGNVRGKCPIVIPQDITQGDARCFSIVWGELSRGNCPGGIVRENCPGELSYTRDPIWELSCLACAINPTRHKFCQVAVETPQSRRGA